MKMIRLHQPRDGAVEGQRGAGIAGRGAGRPPGADQPGMAERRRHAVILEAAGRVHPLVLQVQAAGRHARVLGDAFGGVEQRLPLADGHALLKGGKRQQIVESPHAAEAVRIVAPGPLLFEGRPGSGYAEPIPLVRHIQEAAAIVAGNPNLVHGVGGTARGRNTLLIDCCGGRNRRAFIRDRAGFPTSLQSRQTASFDQGPIPAP